MMYKLSILIHGHSDADRSVKQLNLKLQEQLNELFNKLEVNSIEAIFYLHPDKDSFKRKKWCLANSSGEFYIELEAPFKIEKNYVKKKWFNIHHYEDDEKKLAEFKIFKRKPYQVNHNLPAFQAATGNENIEDVEYDEIESDQIELDNTKHE